jgi:hypothetical protein
MAVQPSCTLTEHLLSVGWPEQTVQHVIEEMTEAAIGPGGSEEASLRAADACASKVYSRHDFRAQLAIWRGELPPEAIEVTPDPPTTLDGGAFMQITQCYSCGGIHEHVPVTPYRTDNAPWTHWYMCAENNEPVPLAIQIKQGNPVEVVRRFIRDLDMAMAHDNVLACIFYVARDGKLRLMCHTDKFAHAMLDEAPKLLTSELPKLGGVAKPTEPLKKATNARRFPLPADLFKRPPVAEAAVDAPADEDEGDH